MGRPYIYIYVCVCVCVCVFYKEVEDLGGIRLTKNTNQCCERGSEPSRSLCSRVKLVHDDMESATGRDRFVDKRDVLKDEDAVHKVRAAPISLWSSQFIGTCDLIKFSRQKRNLIYFVVQCY